MIKIISYSEVFLGWHHHEPYRKKVTFPISQLQIIEIRLDLYNGLRREVVKIAMPFGTIPKGFLFCLSLMY